MRKEIIENLMYVRYSQLLINEKIKEKKFKIPIHLALGHEAIATAVAYNFSVNDNIILTHRNLHYNLAIIKDYNSIMKEFILKKSGLANGKLGSMNLCSPRNKVVYTSSILGNPLPVSVGVALSEKNKSSNTFVVTGDGAMEEGSFYESIIVANSLDISLTIIVENNQWSMYTPIEQRRKQINIKQMADGLGAKYFFLNSNDTFEYCDKISKIKKICVDEKKVCIVEVDLRTLGDWEVKEPDMKKRLINYHHGGAPKIEIKNSLIINKNKWDPLFRVFSKELAIEIDKFMKKKFSCDKYT